MNNRTIYCNLQIYTCKVKHNILLINTLMTIYYVINAIFFQSETLSIQFCDSIG